MINCGVVAEYNPFHAGHAYHCAEIRRKYADSRIIAVMSGNYVQRGDLAVWEKYRRAAFAVRSGGPDLIVELSLPAALGSAEHFADGAVRQLVAAGLLTHLSFGSECGDRSLLCRAASLMQSDAFSACLNDRLSSGIGYAAACEQALTQLAPECGSLLRSPNDTLGIQYIRALLRHSPSPVEIFPVRRVGAAHDSADENAFPSASLLRKRLAEGQPPAPYLPDECADWECTFLTDRQTEIFSCLRRLSADDLAALPHISEGLEHRLYRAIQQSTSLTECIEQATSRRYPAARIRRLLMSAFVGLRAEHSAAAPQYLRVLAFNETGRGLLRDMKETCTLPVITKPLSARNLDGDARALWELDMRADDLYHFPKPTGSGWKQTAAYLP